MDHHNNIKVLIVVHDLRVGNGIAACLMNYYKYTVGKGMQIDFLLYREVESHYMDEVRTSGSDVYILPIFTGKPNKQNTLYIESVLSKDYDIVHVNTSGFCSLVTLKIAKSKGIKIRIYHTHNPIQAKKLELKAYLKVCLRNLLYVRPSIKVANYYLACSDYAGRSTFGNKSFKILYNAIDTSQYAFNSQHRDNIRKELNIKDAFVVGVVGRIEEQKNPEFVIRIFAELVKKRPDSILIWAGDGQRKSSAMSTAQTLNVDDKVRFLGIRNDVNKLYSAMDVFLLPSKFEGLGIVFIEAQSAGLVCVGSDQVPNEVEVTELMHRFPLSEGEEYWAEEMNTLVSIANNRMAYHSQVNESNFEITNVSGALKSFYMDSYLKVKSFWRS